MTIEELIRELQQAQLRVADDTAVVVADEAQDLQPVIDVEVVPETGCVHLVLGEPIE
jgi:hypothetical protein